MVDLFYGAEKISPLLFMQVLEQINNYYSSDKIIQFYSEASLFPEEKVIFNNYLTRSGQGAATKWSYRSGEQQNCAKKARCCRTVVRKEKILDLCCGAGRASFPLAEMGFEVTGIDVNENLIRAAREKMVDYPQNLFILSDVETVKLPENYFDYILILHNSLEFIPGKEKRNNIIGKLNRCLKKEGLLISTFHSAYYPFPVAGKLIANNLKRQVAATKWSCPELVEGSYSSGEQTINTCSKSKSLQGDSIKNIHNPDLEYNDFFYKKGGLFYHIFTPREIIKVFNRNNFKVQAVHGCWELLSQANPLKKSLCKFLIPFDYTFWIFRKKINT